MDTQESYTDTDNERIIYIDDELWNADPDCDHKIVDKMSGIECIKCGGWYCL